MLADNTIDIFIDNVICLGTLTVKGFMIYILINIRCTPTTHFHCIFFRNIQHSGCTCKNVSAVMKANSFNTILMQKFLETLANSIGRYIDAIGILIVRNGLDQLIDICRQIHITSTFDRFTVICFYPAIICFDNLTSNIQTHFYRINITELQPCYLHDAK